MSKTNFEVHMKHYWWNKTTDEISPVFVQIPLNFEYIFSSSNWKLFSVLFRATVYILSFKKMYKEL